MDGFRRVLTVAGKDLLRLRRDRFGIAFALGFPAAFSVAFFFMLGPILSDVAEDAPPPTITLASEEIEPWAISRQLIAALGETESEEFQFAAIDPAAARAGFDSGELAGYIAFPEDFSEGIISGAGSRIRVFAGPDPQEQAALESFANSLAGQFQLQAALAGTLAPVVPPLAALEGAAPRFDNIDVGRIEPPNAADTTVPGYVVMFVFMAAAFTASEMARERKAGTLARMVTAGAAPTQIIFGRYIAAAVLGVLQIAVLGVFGVVAFGMDLGQSPAATVAVGLLMVLVSAAFGIMLASLVRTERAATPAAVLASLVAAPLGGCWWPLYIVPDWMRSLALVTPHGWATTAFNRLMLFGGEFSSVGGELIALAGFAIAFGAIAAWRFRGAPLID